MSQPLPANPTPVASAGGGYSYDVFVAYAAEDAAWMDAELFPRLEAFGLLACSDQTYVPGKPLIENVEDAVVASRYVLAAVTPAWLGDRWARYAGTVVRTTDVVDGRRRFVAVLVRPCPLPHEIGAAVADLSDGNAAAAGWDRLREHLTTYGADADLPRIRAATTFRKLGELMRDRGDAVRKLVYRYEGEFQPEVERTRDLRQLKRVHDLLHDVLVKCYRPTQMNSYGFPKGPVVRAVNEAGRKLAELAVSLAAAVARLPRYLPPPVYWVAEVQAAADALADAAGLIGDPAGTTTAPRFAAWAAAQAGLAARLAGPAAGYPALAAERLDDGIALLRGVVDKLDTVNTKLFTLAQTIRLRELAGTMRTILGELAASGLEPIALAGLEPGAEGLELLNGQMDYLKGEHDIWQQTETLFRATEAQLSGEVAASAATQDKELRTLSRALEKFRKLTARSAGPDSADRRTLRAEEANLMTAVDARNHFDAVCAFDGYRAAAGSIFYEADKNLLKLCDALGGVGGQLTRMLNS